MLKQRLLMAAAGDIPTPPVLGSLYSWGSNGSGQTGLGVASGYTTTPTVQGSSGWKKIAAADYSYTGGASIGAPVTAIKHNGTLWGWGSNGGSGFCGLGSVTNVTSPTQVGVDSDWIDVAQGAYGGLGIKSDHTLWSWGLDAYGQLGKGGGSVVYLTPTQVGSGTTWAKVFTAHRVTFLIDTSGALWTIGTPLAYENGLGSGAVLSPTQVGVATNWVQMGIYGEQQNTGGLPFSLGLRSDGTIWSVGSNVGAQTGQGTDVGDTMTFTQIGTDTDWRYIAGVSSYALNTVAYYGSGYAIKNDNSLWSWGAGATNGQGSGADVLAPTQIGTDTDWLMVCGGSSGGTSSVGYQAIGFAVALKTDGRLYAWGSNENGQAGLGGLVIGSTTPPTQVGTDSDWTYIAAGGSQTPVGNGGGCFGFALKG